MTLPLPSNIKIQRPRLPVLESGTHVLPAADLERSKDVSTLIRASKADSGWGGGPPLQFQQDGLPGSSAPAGGLGGATYLQGFAKRR
jgi:hypothetical protein